MAEEDQVRGTVLRGADGTLYFIPAGDLAAYQIPDEEQDTVEDAIERGGSRALRVVDAQIEIIAEVEGPASVLGETGPPDSGETKPPPDAGETLPPPDAGETGVPADSEETEPPDAGETIPPDTEEAPPDAGETTPPPEAESEGR